MEHEANNAARLLASEARDWVIRRHSGEFGPQDEVELNAWLAQSPEHVAAYDEQERFWSKRLAGLEDTFLEHMDQSDLQSDAADPFRKPASRIPAVTAVIGALAACCALGLFLARGGLAGSGTVYETRVGEIRTVSLEDGTQLSLDTNTSVNVSYDAGIRFVDLKAGAIFLEVEPDPDRPLKVKSGPAFVEVLGTRFMVEQHESATWVGVEHGLVRASVENQAGDSLSTQLQIGQGVSLDASHDELEPVSVDATRLAQWRNGVIEIQGIPLDDALARLDAYYPGEITLERVEGPFEPVSGIFRIDHIEEAVTGLAATHQLSLQRVDDDLVISP